MFPLYPLILKKTTYQVSTFRNCTKKEKKKKKQVSEVHNTSKVKADKLILSLPSGGLKKLKNESLETVFVTVLTVPRPLCFCFFLMVFKVTFFPFFQSIWQLERKEHTQQLPLNTIPLVTGTY